MYTLPLLGPLHTMMNNEKLIMLHHLGTKDRSTLGSLMAFNKKLRRTQKIDDKAKDLWACIDIIRDSLDALLLAMFVHEVACENWITFRANIMSRKIDWRRILKMIS